MSSVVETSFGQNKTLDSLWKVYNNDKQTDSNRKIAGYFIELMTKKKDNKVEELENSQKRLAYSYETKDTSIIVFNLVEIGILYGELHDTTKAMEYFRKAILFDEKSKSRGKFQQVTSYIYESIGAIYKNNNDFKNALVNYQKSLSKAEEEKDKGGARRFLESIGYVYNKLSDYDKAIDYTLRSLKIAEEMKDKGMIAWAYVNLAEIYKNQRNYQKAKNYSEKALVLFKKQLDVSNVRKLELLTSQIDSASGNGNDAYKHYKQYIILRDKLKGEEVSKAVIREKLQAEANEQKAEQDKKDAIAVEEKQKQQIVIYGVAAVLLIVVVFSALLYKRFRLINKQKHIIELKSKETEEQKRLVEEKNHEIIDSITYAKRLQQAILPTIAAVQEQLPNSFIYYQPKDIVAGDFYWMHTTKEAVYIASADCTGHGVPGAMVSVVCSNALNRAVKEFNLTDTGLILNKTRELVIETFEKSDKDVKDGMDISLLRINTTTKEIQWSGANNSLWYILNNELIEVKADKQPIGKYSEEKPFTTNTISLPFGEGRGGVSFYLFSDGYADQFSPDDKKLMKKKFKDIVLNIQHLAMPEQGKALDKFHTDWKGSMEQTDDVLVIGVKL
ncbi:MAG TPA: SpoIIE family protein phosphatase [Bacteroidia bacterium]